MTNSKAAPALVKALGVVVFTFGVSSTLAACGSNQSAASGNDTSLFPAAYSRETPKFKPGGATGSTVSVDLRPYMAAIIAQKNGDNLTGYMLCDIRTSKSDHCNTSLTTMANEARLVTSKGGGIDYIAIGSHDFESINGSSTKRIGVIRNWTGPDSEGDVLRCFSLPNTICKSPAEKALGPPYLIPYLPVVSESVLNDATNPTDGSPLKPIAGAMVYTNPGNGNYLNFGINYYNNATQCQQTYYGTDQSKGLVVYVTGVHFQGTLGKQDAIVEDGYSGQSSAQDHVERDFYVLGVGRVRSGIAFYDPSDGLYDNTPHYDAVHSNEVPINPDNFNFQGEQCNQGSAVPLWPTSAATLSLPK